MSNKIGFWPVLAIVIGIQVGSGVFILPSALASYGYFASIGWIISGAGAIALASVFGILCARFPTTGGPHVYVQHAFGQHAAFFIGWAYWVVQSFTSVAVIVASIGYLHPFVGNQSPNIYIALEIALLGAIILLNLKGISFAGRAELGLSIVKFIPLLILPISALWFFNIDNFTVSPGVTLLNNAKILGQVTTLTMWCFIGVEAGTTIAGSVIEPSKTIPRAVLLGTICVALIYFINSIGIMGVLSPTELTKSNAPYVDVTRYMFGGNWHLLIAIIAFLVCVGTLNAVVLTSSQIGLGLAQDGLIPAFFSKRNANNVPAHSVLASTIPLIPILILGADKTLAKQINLVVDLAVTVFLVIYLICSLACVKTFHKSSIKLFWYQWVAIFVSIIFCSWVLYETPLQALTVSILFILSGLPVYLFWYCRSHHRA